MDPMTEDIDYPSTRRIIVNRWNDPEEYFEVWWLPERYDLGVMAFDNRVDCRGLSRDCREGPARLMHRENAWIEDYLLDGQWHRPPREGPSRITASTGLCRVIGANATYDEIPLDQLNSFGSIEFWYTVHGKQHRLDGPARVRIGLSHLLAADTDTHDREALERANAFRYQWALQNQDYAAFEGFYEALLDYCEETSSLEATQAVRQQAQRWDKVRLHQSHHPIWKDIREHVPPMIRRAQQYRDYLEPIEQKPS